MAPNLLEIVGQLAAVTRLQRAMLSGRTPHALLFAGPQGVGRRTAALALGRTLLCEQPLRTPNAGRLDELPPDAPLTDACGACPSCRLGLSGSHPDLHLVYKELAAYHDDADVRARKMQDLGIDVLRQFLLEPAGRASERGKVFVVLEAELMSIAAQNALLKTLEEPPPGVTIILLCQRPEQMLPTTLSRCRLIRFVLLPRQFVTQRLVEEYQVPAAEADFWAGFTGGSIGQSRRLAQAGMYEIKRQLIEQIAALPPAGDAELGEQFARTMDALADDEVRRSKADGSAELAKTVAGRRAAGMMLRLLGSAYRDALALSTGARLELVHTDQTDAIGALAGRFDLHQLASIIEQLSRYEELIWRNVGARVVWDNVVITCASAAPLAV